MSTRGILGFHIDGSDKLTYNHSDSYPEWLGERVIAFLTTRLAAPDGLDQLKADARELRLVDSDSVPTAAEVKRYAEFGDLGVNTGKYDNWYNLLRRAQGDPELILRAGVMEDGRDFANDSLFCEWGWVVNLDDEVLEVYKGFQRRKHTKGRYAGKGHRRGNYKGAETYWPIALVATYPFSALPTTKQLVADVDPEEVEVDR